MKKINYIDSIRNPIITEKATILSEQNKTVFKVHDKANKKNIKKNIEKLFKVNVVKINIINQKSKIKMKQGKKSLKSGYKKWIFHSCYKYLYLNLRSTVGLCEIFREKNVS